MAKLSVEQALRKAKSHEQQGQNDEALKLFVLYYQCFQATSGLSKALLNYPNQSQTLLA